MIEEDEDLNLTILFSHSVIKAQWSINDTFIENSSINYTKSMKNNRVTLMIKNASVKHSGKYQVQVWDSANQTNQSLTIVYIYSFRKMIKYNRIICNYYLRFSSIASPLWKWNDSK